MLRSSPSRNQRSKGIRVKHVLQTCLLLAVCFWLIYQVKHSHDKKKEFDENDAEVSLKMGSGDEISKFGRKDLHPRVEETVTKNEKHYEEEEEEEETGGGDENKHEEEEQEEDSRTEEKEDEGRGGGDDEMDEHDLEKSNMEVDREEDSIDEEEREEGDEKESEDRDAEDKEGQIENESSSEDHEAQEKHYKGDDASSAVAHDTQTITTETNIGSLENLNENTEMNVEEQENRINTTEEIKDGQNTTGLNEGDGEMAKNGIPLIATANEEKVLEIVTSKSEDSSVLNSTLTTEVNNQSDVSTKTDGLTLQNGTEAISDPTRAENATVGETTSGEDSSLQTIALEQANNSNIASNNNQSDFNLTISLNTENAEAITGESSNSSSNLESVAPETVIRSSLSAEAEDNSGSPTTENIDATQNEKSETSDGRDRTNQSSNTSKTENSAEIQHDPINFSDSSIPLEEHKVRIDLDTLPEIRNGVSNNEDAAAE